jgi:hypothetical protein
MFFKCLACIIMTYALLLGSFENSDSYDCLRALFVGHKPNHVKYLVYFIYLFRYYFIFPIDH